MKDKYIQTTFGRLHAVVAGAGDPLLLFHGSSEANSWRTWERNIEPLASCARVYALDLIGYGGSDRTVELRDTDAEVTALVQLLEVEGISLASVAGVSWGGQIAQELALAVPERIRRLVLVDSAFDPSEQGLARLRQIGQPALIVWDEDDVVIPVHFAPVLVTALPHARLEILNARQRDADADPANKHWSQMSHSGIFNQMVKTFLAEREK